jgi:hypothetical protein
MVEAMGFTFNGLTSVMNFIEFYQLVQKLMEVGDGIQIGRKPAFFL